MYCIRQTTTTLITISRRSWHSPTRGESQNFTGHKSAENAEKGDDRRWWLEDNFLVTSKHYSWLQSVVFVTVIIPHFSFHLIGRAWKNLAWLWRDDCIFGDTEQQTEVKFNGSTSAWNKLKRYIENIQNYPLVIIKNYCQAILYIVPWVVCCDRELLPI